MEITEPADPVEAALPEVERHLRHNFTVNLLNSSFLTFAGSLISSGVILPLFVSNLSDSKVLVGLIMTISFAGVSVPQLFATPIIARFPQIKKLLVPSVLIAERLPLLLLGLAIFLLVPLNPPLALVVFFILLTWNTVGAGFNAVGMQELYARIIPLEKRGRLTGIAGVVGIGLAVIGAIVNRAVLERFAFPNGYALLFLGAGVCSLIAWFWLTRVHEPWLAAPPRAQGYAAFLKKIPSVLRADANYSRFIISMCVLYLGGMSGNFLAVAAKERWGLPESVIVTFPIAMYLGQAVGNLVCGWIADRIGYKVLQIIANAANVALLLVAILTSSPMLFYLVFALKGLSIAADILGNMITFEFSSLEMRPTYIGIYNTITGAVFIFSPLFAGVLAERLGYAGLFGITAAITMLGIVMLQFFVRDPRTLTRSH